MKRIGIKALQAHLEAHENAVRIHDGALTVVTTLAWFAPDLAREVIALRRALKLAKGATR